MFKNISKVSNVNKQGMFFLAEICRKMDFGIGIFKILPRIQNQLFQDTMFQFLGKMDKNWLFWSKFA